MLKKSPNLSLYMLINVMLINATAADCAHELINGESVEAGKILQN